MTTIVETPRLVLREMSVADLDFIAFLLAHPKVMRFYPKCYTRAEAESWVLRQLERYARDGHGLWLALDRFTGEPIGQVGLAMQSVDGVQEPEVGYMIHPAFWRRGLASEAAKATRDFAFRRLGKLRVISLIRPVNLPSQGVARKLGMSPAPRTVQFGGFEHLVFSVEQPAPRP
jgi:RimJ/RimL family protein N-acetyltransferase